MESARSFSTPKVAGSIPITDGVFPGKNWENPQTGTGSVNGCAFGLCRPGVAGVCEEKGAHCSPEVRAGV